MAHTIPNLFTQYQLTDEEQLQGSILTIAQKQLIQNERAKLAEERSNLTIDVDNLVGSAQAEAYILGQLHILGWLLELSDVANAELNNPDYIPTTEEES